MRIRFNISPTGDTEVAIVSLINGYPDGQRSELVRRLIVIGFNLHSNDDDILSGINIHSGEVTGGTMCKFNISPLVPQHDPAVMAYNKAKSLNSLIKPLYLNKLIKTGYLFEMGMLKDTPLQIDNNLNNPKPEITVVVNQETHAVADERLIVSQPVPKNASRTSLKDNPGLRISLKNLAG
ncbi:MAG: hypothetical protein ACJAS1_007180 [Oleiphilaceae bacterium]|jgi:hypothetical protein